MIIQYMPVLLLFLGLSQILLDANEAEITGVVGNHPTIDVVLKLLEEARSC